MAKKITLKFSTEQLQAALKFLSDANAGIMAEYDRTKANLKPEDVGKLPVPQVMSLEKLVERSFWWSLRTAYEQSGQLPPSESGTTRNEASGVLPTRQENNDGSLRESPSNTEETRAGEDAHTSPLADTASIPDQAESGAAVGPG